MVQLSLVLVDLSPWPRLLTLVHADKHRPVCGEEGIHDVALVLFGPGGRTAGLSWDHQSHLAGAGETHGTGDVPVINTVDDVLVLNAIHKVATFQPTDIGVYSGSGGMQR